MPFKLGKIEQYLHDDIAKKRGLLMAVIDPLDHPSIDAAAKAGGFFAVLVPHAYSGAASEMGPNLTVDALDDERLLGLFE